MEIRRLYKKILERKDLWNYYNKDLKAPDITDTDDCYRFITEYIEYSEKSKTVLFENVKCLSEHSPQRLSHIVSTFFLGLWFYHNMSSRFLHNSIKNELKKLSCFQNDYDDIEKQFTFVWFMATLFHDLGYPAEDKEGGTNMPYHDIPISGSVPDFYRYVYNDYYAYRKNKEHGIFAGMTFDKDICDIRRFQSIDSSSHLDWKEELEELYHYVAWIVLSHNIWMIRDNDKSVEAYKKAGLKNLILYSEKNEKGLYVDYKIRFENYPLFTFFCIVDTIEPLKSSSCLFDIDIQLKHGKIIIESNDSVYLQKIKGLNDWLTPTTEGNDTVIIHLRM